MSVDRGHCRETVVLKAKYDAALTFIESRRVQPSDCIFWNHGRRDDDAHGGEDRTKRSTPSSMMIVGRSVTAFSETASDRLKRNSPRKPCKCCRPHNVSARARSVRCQDELSSIRLGAAGARARTAQ